MAIEQLQQELVSLREQKDEANQVSRACAGSVHASAGAVTLDQAVQQSKVQQLGRTGTAAWGPT